MPNNVYDYYVDLIANLNKEVKDLKEKKHYTYKQVWNIISISVEN